MDGHNSESCERAGFGITDNQLSNYGTKSPLKLRLSYSFDAKLIFWPSSCFPSTSCSGNNDYNFEIRQKSRIPRIKIDMLM